MIVKHVAAAFILVALLACGRPGLDTGCKHEGDTRTRRTGHGIVHERCELHNDGLRWTEVSR